MEGKKNVKHNVVQAKKPKRRSASSAASKDGASVSVRVEKPTRRRTATPRPKAGAKPRNDTDTANNGRNTTSGTSSPTVEDAVPAKPQLREHPAITKARAEGRITPVTDKKLAAQQDIVIGDRGEVNHYNPHGQYQPEKEYMPRSTWGQIELTLLFIAVLGCGVVAIITGSESLAWGLFIGYVWGVSTHLHRRHPDEG